MSDAANPIAVFCVTTRLMHDETPFPARLAVELWRPSWMRVRPRGFTGMRWAVWWAAHHTHAFRNREYQILVVRDSDDRVVHRSVVTPGYFRFPFMAPADLQVGDVWTAPEWRRQGLAAAALTTIVNRVHAPRVWYLTDRQNEASLRTAQRAGLTKVGSGRRTERFGSRLLGAYVLEHLQ